MAKRQAHFSPIATALWPALQTPSVYVPKGGTPDPTDKGRYSVKLRLNPDDAKVQDWISEMEQVAEDLYQEHLRTIGKVKCKVKDPMIPVVDEEDKEGNLTGMKLASFALKAGGVNKRGEEWERPLPLLDAMGKVWTPEGSLGNGTRLRVSYELNDYTSSGVWGISFRLRAAQIISPEYFASSAESDFAGMAVADEEFDIVGLEASDGDY